MFEILEEEVSEIALFMIVRGFSSLSFLLIIGGFNEVEELVLISS